jgi:putative oxidoreductase
MNRTNDTGLLLIRLALGAVFVVHGAQKLFGLFGGPGLEGTAKAFDTLDIPVPMAAAVLAGCAEFLGGIGLIVGVAVRAAGVFLAITMAVAIWTSHRDAFSAQHGGMEFPLTLGLCAAALALLGSGSLALRPTPPR